MYKSVSTPHVFELLVKMASREYEYNFIEDQPNLEVLKCSICDLLPQNPVDQHETCGKLFCNACIQDYGEDQPCKFCGEEIPIYFNDLKSKFI